MMVLYHTKCGSVMEVDNRFRFGLCLGCEGGIWLKLADKKQAQEINVRDLKSLMREAEYFGNQEIA